MTRRRKNQSQQKHEESLQKPDGTLSKTTCETEEDPDDSDVITPNVILPSSSTPPLLNAQIIQILVQRDTPEGVEKLMRAELDYNKERLQILREHAENIQMLLKKDKHEAFDARSISF